MLGWSLETNKTAKSSLWELSSQRAIEPFIWNIHASGALTPHNLLWISQVTVAVTYLNTLKYAWVQIFSSAIQTTELPWNIFLPVFLFPQLSNFLPTYFSPPSLRPMFIRNQIRDRWWMYWNEDIRDAIAMDGGLGRAVKSLKRGSYFRIFRADGVEHDPSPKHNGTSFAECQWWVHWNWDQQLTSHAAVLCCPNWWPVATCSYLNQN